MAKIADQHYEADVPITTLKLHDRNARQGDVGLIHGSIEENDFYGACIVQRSTRRIIAGNHRYLAAVQAGLTHIPVIWVEAEDERALRVLLADNRSSDSASYDMKALAALLSELQQSTDNGLAGTGFTDEELDEIINDLLPKNLQPEKAKETGDDAPTQPGVLVLCQSPMDQDEICRKINSIGWISRKVTVTEEILTVLGGAKNAKKKSSRVS